MPSLDLGGVCRQCVGCSEIPCPRWLNAAVLPAGGLGSRRLGGNGLKSPGLALSLGTSASPVGRRSPPDDRVRCRSRWNAGDPHDVDRSVVGLLPRRGRVHQIYSISRSPGLSDHVLGHLELGRVARRVEGAEGLYVIPTGTAPPNPAAFVGLPGFAAALNGVARQVNTVILDAPPLLAVSDTYTMARNVDGVVLTVRAGTTTRSELSEVITVLAQVEANVLGVVMIGAKESETYGGRYYATEHTGQLPAAITSGAGEPRRSGRRRRPSGQIQVADDLSIVYNTGRTNLRTHDTGPGIAGHLGAGEHDSARSGPPTPIMNGSGEVLRLGDLDDYQAGGDSRRARANGQNGNQGNGSRNGSHRDGEPTSLFPEMFDR